MIFHSALISRRLKVVYPAILFCLLLVWGCATAPSQPEQAEPGRGQVTAPRTERERRSADYVILIADQNDSYESLARTYLGDGGLAYLISESNKDVPISSGKEVVIPLKPLNPGGLYLEGFQTIPVLSYHQFGHKPNPNSMFVSEAAFDQQMAYLKKNGYTVITLKQFLDFVEYRRRPPKKSVMITIDDGWKSAKTIALPILKKYGFTAVLFIYTDLIKSKQNSVTLSWDEVRQLKETGVFEVQAHTISHSDLSKVSDDQLIRELREPLRVIASKTGSTPDALAYPYGVFNDKVVDAVKKSGYRAAFTVIRGGNAFFYSPFSLNRTMVKGEKLEDFKKNLEVFRQE